MASKHCTYQCNGETCDKPREVRLVVKRRGMRQVNEDYCQHHASFRKWQYRGTYVRVVRYISLVDKTPKPAAPAQTSLNLEV